MSTSYPVGVYPPFNNPLTRNNTNKKTDSTNDSLSKKRINKPKPSKEATEDYIRNLQQQIYLLELETRYMRSAKSRGECGNSSNSQDLNNMINNSSSSLNEIINGLKYKYVELQEKNKNDLKKLEEEIEKEKKEFPKKDTEIEKLNMDIDMLKNEVTLLKEHGEDERKDLYNENMELKKKLETINSDITRNDISYKRVLKEKEELIDSLNKLRAEHSSMDEKYEDLQNIEVHLKQKIEELGKDREELMEKNFEQANTISNINLDSRQFLIESIQKEKVKLMGNIKRLEVAFAEEKQLREKVISDRDKTIEENVSLKTQIEELQKKLESDIKKGDESFLQRRTAMQNIEQMQKQIEKYKDEVDSLKMANENKEKKIKELKEKISNQESSVNKVLETKAIFEDTIAEIKIRLEKMEEELTQTSKDKIDLQMENESLKKGISHQKNEINRLNNDLDEVHGKLKEYMNDRNVNQEIKQLIDQIESSGDNYIRLMKSVKSRLDKSNDEHTKYIYIFAFLKN
jgi:chromosome segregation ATPase